MPPVSTPFKEAPILQLHTQLRPVILLALFITLGLAPHVVGDSHTSLDQGGSWSQTSELVQEQIDNFITGLNPKEPSTVVDSGLRGKRLSVGRLSGQKGHPRRLHDVRSPSGSKSEKARVLQLGAIFADFADAPLGQDALGLTNNSTTIHVWQKGRHLLSQSQLVQEGLPRPKQTRDPTGLHVVPIQELLAVGQTQEESSGRGREDAAGEPVGDVFSNMEQMEELGNTTYRFHNVCLRPSSEGGLHFYYDPAKAWIRFGLVIPPAPRVRICNEHVICRQFYFRVIPSPAPRRWDSPPRPPTPPPPPFRLHPSMRQEAPQWGRAKWHRATEATAVIEPMTRLTGWHLLHHLISLTQLLREEETNISSPTVHLHPTFSTNQLRWMYRSGGPDGPFSEAGAPFWPLLKAVAPPDTHLVQVNLLEPTPSESSRRKLRLAQLSVVESKLGEANSGEAKGSTLLHGGARRGLAQVDNLDQGQVASSQKLLGGDHLTEVCYETLYLGSPRMETQKGAGGRRLWGEIKPSAVHAFRDRVLQLAEASNLRSGFCPLKGGWQGEAGAERGRQSLRPLLVLVVRRTAKRILKNVREVRKEMEREGFGVEEVRWEGMSIWEQVRTARRADVLVGVHGNGLTHVLWMRPGTALVEIFPPGPETKLKRGVNKNRQSNYGSLAAFAKVSHFVLQGKSQKRQSFVVWRNRDVVVALPQLQKVLKDVGKLMDHLPPCS